MSEFMGLVCGEYDAKAGKGFQAAGASLHNVMTSHGPDAATFEKASNAELKPQKVGDGSMAFMFESCLFLGVTEWGLETCQKIQPEYNQESCRPDFTTCFPRVLEFLVSIFGTIIGAPTAWWVFPRKDEETVMHSWLFWTKLVVNDSKLWADDFGLWTSATSIVSLLLVFFIQYFEKSRLRGVSGFVASYWLLLMLTRGAKLLSSVTSRAYQDDVWDFVYRCISFGLVCVESLLLLERSINACPWMTPMMRHGHRKYITEDDLWDIANEDTAKVSIALFQCAWDREQETKQKPSLRVALFRTFGTAYTQGALFKAGADVLAILQPQLLRLLISFVDSYSGRDPQPFTLWFAQSLCLHQCFQRLAKTGIKLKSSLISTIYRKSLKLSNEARGAKSTGDIVNLMVVNSQRLQDVTQFSQHLCLLGYSMFAGVALMIATIPLNGGITKATKNLQKYQMKNKGARSKLIAEVITNIKSIKLFAWSSVFANRIGHIRNDKELVTLRKTGALQAVSSFIGFVTAFLVACSAFAVRTLVQGKPLTTKVVFPAIALFQLLASPLTILPAAILSLAEASVAVSRLVAFFTADELQSDAVIREDTVTKLGDESVSICDATFTWSSHERELCCLVGRVGSGKSSILHVVLGDLYKVNGSVTLRGSVAYVSQQPWVLNASVRENITFGISWDPEFYVETVKLPNGDQTEVGDKGITLSGGQKARLTLARAVYARADIYLLDDCLSAVDQHVGRHLIEEVLGPQDGKILKQGTYSQLKPTGGNFTNLIGQGQNLDQSDAASASQTRVTSTGAVTTDVKRPVEAPRTLKMTEVVILSQSSSLNDQTNLERSILRSNDPDIEAAKRKPKRKELMQQRSVKWRVYGEYAKASSLFAVAIYALALVGALVAEIGKSDPGLAKANDKPDADVDVRKYLGVYVAFGLGSAGLVILQSSTLWLWCSIKASRKLHESMIVAILRSPMAFFETTPAGQILNRFFSDIYRIDQSLPRQFNTLFINSVKALFSLAVISSGAPAFIILDIPLVLLYSYMQQYYLGAKRELKRLDGVSRSPVFAYFQDSLDANMKAYVPSITANRWLGVRLELIGSIIILTTAGLSLPDLSLGNHLSAGMVGLIISYALQITKSFSSLVRATGEVETNIVSAERVLEYTQLPSEAPEVIPNHRPAVSWPARGFIKFVDYSTRYRPDLPLILQDLNLDFKLSRWPSGGSIDIDDINTLTIGLLDLRQRLIIIPQDPALFEGSIRGIIDPAEDHDDTELWTSLELARLKEHVVSMAGSNLRQGQKQLMSLARAMLKPANILAAVDVETDTHLQQTLRENIFSNRTVITIAHRINTIIDSDRIVVLENGKVVEFDAPAVLMRQKGAFHQLVREAGRLEGS
ncbi:ABC transporter type 1, transmembrane domain-containing protein [Dactylonectria macrodidyma]|uniref:ABC transporter type 1, transmembrane domain-containing protein n=1 Tax=Dactylonectria macrodidyma TaxID=307937 RepID=A0A9P9IYS5_9HYPO|nr:ABC transporter type 1, transmembrane domain-containing protein [Dactylonectria macrodidyma]